MKIQHLTILLFFVFSFSANAQQYPLFSHYQQNSFGFNPAIAGCTECPEARLVYRKQWEGLKESPTTQILSMQGRLKKLPIGVGGFVFNDEAGKLKRSGGSGALTFVKKLDSLTNISVGLGFGYYNIRLNNQYNAFQGNDPTIMNAENGLWLFDLSGGVYVEREGAYLGFSVPQILEPTLKFEDDTDPLNDLVRHYYLMGGYKLKLNDKFTVEPSAVIKFVENTPLNWEATARAIYRNKYWAGGTFRNDNTIAIMAGIELNQRLLLGYAFDLTTSNLNLVSNGGHEITLGYRFCKPKDTDGDGLLDHKDKCPDKPGPEENDGCPEEEEEEEEEKEEEEPLAETEKKENPVAETPKKDIDDKDNDGIRDSIDKCPDIAGSMANSGCPIDDRDKDGIVDHKDKCPDLAGPLQTEGCPGEDTDKDGVVDAIDKCPNQPGPLFNDGCPNVAAAGKIPLDDIKVRNVYFDTDKDIIKNHYHSDLDQLAEYMIDNPSWNLELIGHTDERASAEYNRELSKRRVEAVMFYLLNRGVKRNQVRAEYYGESDPAEYEKSEAGFQLNRRVEVRLLFE